MSVMLVKVRGGWVHEADFDKVRCQLEIFEVLLELLLELVLGCYLNAKYIRSCGHIYECELSSHKEGVLPWIAVGLTEKLYSSFCVLFP